MKNIILLLFFGFVFCINTSAQVKPFDLFEKTLGKEKHGLNGDKELLSSAFNADRNSLGSRFEEELWKNLDNDFEKHYLVGLFLQTSEYMHGSSPLPQLALAVWARALETQGTTPIARRFSLLVLASVLAQKLEQKDTALRYKAEAVQIAATHVKKELEFPVMEEYERCIYQEIDTGPIRCEAPKGEIFTKRVIDGSALALPQPIMPEEPKKKNIRGTVGVQITIDEQGDVVAAEAVSGPAELFAAAVRAARKARFVPTIISGKPEKVSGFISYKF